MSPGALCTSMLTRSCQTATYLWINEITELPLNPEHVNFQNLSERRNEQNRRNLFKRLINEYNNAITRTYDSFTTSIHSAHTLQTTTQHRNVNDKTKWSKHSKTYDSPLNTTKFETKRHGIGRSEATLRNQLSINDYSYTLPKITTPPTIPLSPDIFVKQTKNQLSLVARLGDWRVWERG